MLTVTQIFGALVVFIVVRVFVFQLTEVWGLPKAFDFAPWNCQICCSFWLLLAISITFYLLHLPIIASTILLLDVLNTIAMKVHQKTHTITLEEEIKQ